MDPAQQTRSLTIWEVAREDVRLVPEGLGPPPHHLQLPLLLAQRQILPGETVSAAADAAKRGGLGCIGGPAASLLYCLRTARACLIESTFEPSFP